MSVVAGKPVRALTIRVLVATGEPLFGDAIERVVRQCASFQLVGEAQDAVAALEQLRITRPDVAVLGPSLPALDRRRLLGMAQLEGLPTRFVFVGDDFDDEATYDLIGEGAAGLLTKTTNPEQLRDAIAAAAAGREFLSRETLAAVAREIRLRNHDAPPRLTPREREILERITRGESTVAMARAMHLGHSTIKTHCHHLFEKLGVSDRASAVAEGFRRGLLS